MNTITITTDGACSGNPGPGGLAAIIEHPTLGEFTVTGGDPDTTNNRMELAAIIEALRTINQDHDSLNAPIVIRTDSQYVAKPFTDNWLDNWQRRGWQTAKGTPVLNQDLWQMLLQQMENHKIVWTWIKGHSGDARNERCDTLAVRAAQAARNADGYWAQPHFPHPSNSAHPTEEAAPATASAEEEPTQSAAPAETNVPEACRILQGIAELLDQCDNFDTFRTQARDLFATARW